MTNGTKNGKDILDQAAEAAAARAKQEQRSQPVQPKSPVEDFFDTEEMSPVQAAAILAANRDQMEFDRSYVCHLINGSRTTLVEAASKIEEQKDLEHRIKKETKRLVETNHVSIDQIVEKAAQQRLKEREAAIERMAERESQKIIPISVKEVVDVYPLLGGGAVPALNASR